MPQTRKVSCSQNADDPRKPRWRNTDRWHQRSRAVARRIPDGDRCPILDLGGQGMHARIRRHAGAGSDVERMFDPSRKETRWDAANECATAKRFVLIDRPKRTLARRKVRSLRPNERHRRFFGYERGWQLKLSPRFTILTLFFNSDPPRSPGQ